MNYSAGPGSTTEFHPQNDDDDDVNHFSENQKAVLTSNAL